MSEMVFDGKESEKVSVIIPIYNVEEFLPKCIDSVLRQTFENMEIILVDDGATDHSGKICDAYAQKDARITVVHKKNGGLSSARNAGVDVAVGKYLVFVDSDDYIAEDMVATLYRALVGNCAEMALCNFCYVDEQGNQLPERNQYSPIEDEVLDSDEVIQRLTSTRGCWYYVTAWNKMYQRELFETIRFPEGKLHEDEFIAHQLYGRCKRVACVKKPLYYYLQRTASIMNQQYNIRRLDSAEAYGQRTLFFLEKGFVKPAMESFSAAITVLLVCYGKVDFKVTENLVRMKEVRKTLKTICFDNWKCFIKNTSWKQKAKILMLLANIKVKIK